jgi:hypothetical protein
MYILFRKQFIGQFTADAAHVTGKLKRAKNGKEKSPTKYSLLSIMLVNVIHERLKGNGEGKDVQ